MHKDVSYYMSLPYEMQVTPEEGNLGFVISFPDLPGCLTSGETLEKALQNIEDAKESWFEAAIESEYPIIELIEKGRTLIFSARETPLGFLASFRLRTYAGKKIHVYLCACS